MTRITVTLLAIALCAGGNATANWSVMKLEGQESKCMLESERIEIFDGYQNTAIRMVVDGNSVAVKSVSTLDPGFSDIGIQVDKKAFIHANKVTQDKTASFDINHAALIEQFKAGLEVTVQLRFWPT